MNGNEDDDVNVSNLTLRDSKGNGVRGVNGASFHLDNARFIHATTLKSLFETRLKGTFKRPGSIQELIGYVPRQKRAKTKTYQHTLSLTNELDMNIKIFKLTMEEKFPIFVLVGTECSAAVHVGPRITDNIFGSFLTYTIATVTFCFVEKIGPRIETELCTTIELLKKIIKKFILK